LAGVVVWALPAPAFAYTISGTIPPGRTPVVINLHKPIGPGLVKFKFSAPSVNAGVRYVVGFCIGKRTNPCGMPTSRVVNVPQGQVRSASFPSTLFSTNILVAGQGTRVPVPYSVQVN
jgi:hypothetical protein